MKRDVIREGEAEMPGHNAQTTLWRVSLQSVKKSAGNGRKRQNSHANKRNCRRPPISGERRPYRRYAATTPTPHLRHRRHGRAAIRCQQVCRYGIYQVYHALPDASPRQHGASDMTASYCFSFARLRAGASLFACAFHFAPLRRAEEGYRYVEY